MKRVRSRYTYGLVIVAIIISTLFQAAWLHYLFRSQKRQLKADIEQAVSQAAIRSSYASVRADIDPGLRFRDFFLSPQWLQMRQAFDDIHAKGAHTDFHYQLGTDSSWLDMRVAFGNHMDDKKPAAAIVVNNAPPEALQRKEVLDIRRMDSIVGASMDSLGIHGGISFSLYDYASDSLISHTNRGHINLSPANPGSASPETANPVPAYRSATYAFNFTCLHKYQLVVASINGAVFYRMRYFLLSYALMAGLTGLAFYFLLQMMHRRRLYADAKLAFTSNMTHEFKTPVATVAVALESITRYELIKNPEKLQNYLDISLHELKRLDRMIEQVLNLNQEPASGRASASPPGATARSAAHRELYDVQSGLHEVVAALRIRLEGTGATIAWTASPEPCFVNGDPVHLVNVFYNLADNAIKYAGADLHGSNNVHTNASPHATATLHLEITCAIKGTTVEISFKDNGPGIEKVYHKKIFDRFFRVPLSGDTHDVKGSGLGLHYVKEIIGAHKGSIIIRSEKGRGSQFLIILPLAA